MSDAAVIIDGRSLADKLIADLKNSTAMLKSHCGVVPHLAVLQVGDDPASDIYVGAKETKALDLGFNFSKYKFAFDTPEEEIILAIEKLNQNPKIHGMIVQLPIPQNLDRDKILSTIDHKKDVDGLHPYNMGLVMQGNMNGFVPCTPQGIKLLLESIKINLAGKNVVMVGASNLVGKPLSMLLLNAGATVTIAHSLTKGLPELCKTADLLIVAIGDPEFIEASWIKPGAIVIDVGINRVDNAIRGDVQFENAKRVAGFISPVPGGVGPMTVACLMKNTYLAAERSIIL